MRHEITFQLVNPNVAKWELYTSLMPFVDKICGDHEIIIERRTIDIPNWEMTEIVVVNCQKKLFTAKHKVVELLQTNNIETNVIAMKMIHPPVIKRNNTYWRIQELHQTIPNMDRWVAVMPKIDLYAKSYGITIHRIINRKTFSCAVSYDYIEDHHVEVIAFYAGQQIGGANVYLEHNYCPETVEDIKTDNLFDELSTTTMKHRQLSLL
jgi:hypothetical protein